MKKKTLIKSKIKNKWINVYPKDVEYWLGEYLLASMVIQAYTKKRGVPDRVGKIQNMKEEADGTGIIPYQAEWDGI